MEDFQLDLKDDWYNLCLQDKVWLRNNVQECLLHCERGNYQERCILEFICKPGSEEFMESISKMPRHRIKTKSPLAILHLDSYLKLKFLFLFFERDPYGTFSQKKNLPEKIRKLVLDLANIRYREIISFCDFFVDDIPRDIFLFVKNQFPNHSSNSIPEPEPKKVSTQRTWASIVS